jgi:PAS domain S-box-containing protein
MSAPKNWLVRILERGYSPTDDAELRLKKVALTLVPMIIGPAAFAWGAIYLLLGHTLSGAIPMSYAIVSAISLTYFFNTKRTRFIQYSQLTLVLLLPFMLMWSLGGFAGGSMVMIWSIFSPIAASMFLEKRAATRWFLMYFLLILISVLFDQRLAQLVSPLPDLAISIFYLLNLGCGSAGLYVLVSYSGNEEKRSVKEGLRIAASAFEVQEALMITDAKNVILKVNQAFSETTGYSAEEVVGQTPVMLRSGRHDADFYQQMWQIIQLTGGWKGEVWDKRKNGERYPAWLTISSVIGDDGLVTHYVAAHQDISARKKAEEKILQMAFYDSLTQLPNRQLLLDRMQQAFSFAMRSKKMARYCLSIWIISSTSTIRWGMQWAICYCKQLQTGCNPVCAKQTRCRDWGAMNLL